MKWNLTLLMLLIARIAFGAPETSESLAYKLNLLRDEIESIAEESQQEEKRNEQFVMRGAKSAEAMKEAYTSAENLNALNNRLNVLQTRRSALCEQLRVSYAHSVDALLKDAALQINPKQKGNI